MEDLDEGTEKELRNFLQSSSPEDIHYKNPAAITLEEDLRKRVLPFPPIKPVKILIATVRGGHRAARKASLDNIKPMMHSLVKLAADKNILHMALPLLGVSATEAGSMAVAQLMLEGLTEVRDFGSLRTITLAVSEEEVVEAARRKFNLLTNNLAQPVSNDEPAKEDLLGIAHEVHEMAEMLLLRKVKPPLAVGILGGWGSGKSTVMRLMQVKMDEIRALPVEKGWEDDPGEGTVSPYAGHVYQIVFNAWTYAKSNLWASLMQQIFFALNEQLSRENSLQKDGFSLLDGGPLWKILRDQKQKKRNDLRQTENTLALLKAAHEDAQAARRSSVGRQTAWDAAKDKVGAVLKGVSAVVVEDFFKTRGAPDKDDANEVLDELKRQKKTALTVWKTMRGHKYAGIGLLLFALIAIGGPFLIGWLTNQELYKESMAWLASVSGAFFPLILIMTRIARVYRRSVDAIVEAYHRSVEKAPMDKRLAERRAKDEKAVQVILANKDLSVTIKENEIQDLAQKGNLVAFEHRLAQLEARAKGQRQEVGST